MANFDDLQGAVAQFGAGNKVIFDDIGMPSIMYGVPKMKYSDLITGGTDETLPFWIVDGEEKNTIWVSKFLNIVENDRAYSLGMKLPRNFIDFEQALAACRKKGNGWHLNQTGVFTCINLLAQKLGTVPHGNDNLGKCCKYPYEHGILPQGGEGRTLTGSGEPTWYHNHSASGISDINGNLWEWTSGTRLMDGEIQIIPYGNAMKLACDMSAESTLWKAVMQDGTLAEPGTTGTLKIDKINEISENGKFHKGRLSTTITEQTKDGTGEGEDICELVKNPLAADGINIPKLLIAIGIYPEESATYYSLDDMYVRNHAERIPICGGDFNMERGPSSIHFKHHRDYSVRHLAFRSAFCEL